MDKKEVIYDDPENCIKDGKMTDFFVKWLQEGVCGHSATEVSHEEYIIKQGNIIFHIEGCSEYVKEWRGLIRRVEK